MAFKKLFPECERFPNFFQAKIIRRLETKLGKFWLSSLGNFWGYTFYHERETIEFFMKNKPKLVIDCGAYLGKYTVLSAKLLNSKVISIEPNPLIFKYLVKNVKLNNLDNKVKLYNLALFDKRGEKPLNIILFPPAETTLLQKRKKSKYLKKIKIVVKCEKLDNLIKKLPRKGKIILKVDVEGVEYHVLKGAFKTIKKYSPIVIVEILSKKEEKITNLLKKINYVKVKILDKSNYVFMKKYEL